VTVNRTIIIQQDLSSVGWRCCNDSVGANRKERKSNTSQIPQATDVPCRRNCPTACRSPSGDSISPPLAQRTRRASAIRSALGLFSGEDPLEPESEPKISSVTGVTGAVLAVKIAPGEEAMRGTRLSRVAVALFAVLTLLLTLDASVLVQDVPSKGPSRAPPPPAVLRLLGFLLASSSLEFDSDIVPLKLSLPFSVFVVLVLLLLRPLLCSVVVVLELGLVLLVELVVALEVVVVLFRTLVMVLALARAFVVALGILTTCFSFAATCFLDPPLIHSASDTVVHYLAS
jgi:hypothetical protein